MPRLRNSATCRRRWPTPAITPAWSGSITWAGMRNPSSGFSGGPRSAVAIRPVSSMRRSSITARPITCSTGTNISPTSGPAGRWTSLPTTRKKNRQSERRPFFLWLSYNGPYILPPTVNQPPVSRHADYYEDNVPAMPQNRVHPYMREWARNNTAPAPEPTEGGTYPWAAIDALNNKTAMINIAAEMTHVDEGIGTVLAALDELGLRDETLVVFLADQGSSWGQLGLWGNSSWGDPEPAYNANMQVPLIFRHPGRIEAGATETAMVNQFDLLPTLLEYLGLGHLEIADSPGESFAPMLRGRDVAWEDEVFFEYISTRVIQTRQWKYTKRFLASPNELYDMTDDPGETRNLVDDPAFCGGCRGPGRTPDGVLFRVCRSRFRPVERRHRQGAGLLRPRNQKFRDAFPDWREPFVEKQTAFRDR